LARVFKQIRLTPEVFGATPFTRLLELKRLLESAQIDDRFNWAGLDLNRVEIQSLEAAQ
jgi:hypothetical protein